MSSSNILLDSLQNALAVISRHLGVVLGHASLHHNRLPSIVVCSQNISILVIANENELFNLSKVLFGMLLAIVKREFFRFAIRVNPDIMLEYSFVDAL